MGHVGRGVIPYSLNAKCSVPGTVLEAGTTARMSHRRPLPQRKTTSGQEASNNDIAVFSGSDNVFPSEVQCSMPLWLEGSGSPLWGSDI